MILIDLLFLIINEIYQKIIIYDYLKCLIMFFMFNQEVLLTF